LIADLHALHLRADFFDDADAAVSGDRGVRDSVGGVEGVGGRVAGLRGLIADDDLLRMQRPQRQRLHRQRGAVTDEGLELHSRRLCRALAL